VSYAALGYNGGVITTPDGNSLTAQTGALTSIIAISIEDSPSSTPSSIPGSVASDYTTIVPTVFPISGVNTLHLRMVYSVNHFGTASLYRADNINGNWESQNANCQTGTCNTDVSVGGTYVVQTKTNWGAVVGVTLAIMIVLAVGTFFGYKKYREKYSPAAKARAKQLAANTTDVEKPPTVAAASPSSGPVKIRNDPPKA